MTFERRKKANCDEMPFGGSEGMVCELREKVFAGQTVKTLQNGAGVAVAEW